MYDPRIRFGDENMRGLERQVKLAQEKLFPTTTKIHANGHEGGDQGNRNKNAFGSVPKQEQVPRGKET
jgi:hypothetical protein